MTKLNFQCFSDTDSSLLFASASHGQHRWTGSVASPARPRVSQTVMIPSHDEYQMTSSAKRRAACSRIWAMQHEAAPTPCLHRTWLEKYTGVNWQTTSSFQNNRFKRTIEFAEAAVIEIRNFAFENTFKPKNRVLNHAVGHAKLFGKDADLTNRWRYTSCLVRQKSSFNILSTRCPVLSHGDTRTELQHGKNTY